MGSVYDKILIVEKHDFLRFSLVVEANFSSFMVIESQNYADALKISNSQDLFLVLIDMDADKKSCIDVINKILAYNHQTKIITLSSSENPEYRADAEKAGSFAFLSKRKARKELISIIKAALHRPDSQKLESPASQ